MQTVFLGDPPTLYHLIKARPIPDGLLLQLKEITDRDQADRLRGAVVFVEKESLPKPPPGEIYLYQLEGKTVVTKEGETLGKVEAFLETGATPIMVVRGPKGEYLLPIIEDVVLSVAEDSGIVTINLLEGLDPD